jgi:cobalt-zinc-cadmium efflux system outer membrane protein
MLDRINIGRFLGIAAVVLGFSAPLPAATFRDVLDHAWSNQAQAARARQYAAQFSASQAWVPDPPTLTISNRSDQIDTNNGLREWEAEITQPIWLWGQRERAQAVAKSEREAGTQRFAEGRWQLAGELRETWWEVRLAEAERNEAERKLKEAAQLEADVLRRVKAGDLAPLDLNQVRSSVAIAKTEVLRTQTAVARTLAQYQALSKGAPLPDLPEALASWKTGTFSDHPALASLAAATAAAQAKFRQVSGDTRNAPEIGVTLTRERSNFNEPYQTLAKVALKIPFGSESRNQPRIAAANADWIEAQLLTEQTRRKLDATITANQLELEQSQGTMSLLQERLQLVEQSALWVDKAFHAGQLDLPARLKAESDLTTARLAYSRAKLEAARAISRYNQAVGVLP